MEKRIFFAVDSSGYEFSFGEKPIKKLNPVDEKVFHWELPRTIRSAGASQLKKGAIQRILGFSLLPGELYEAIFSDINVWYEALEREERKNKRT